MRTPGHDDELACGFLLSEGILSRGADIERISFCGLPKGEQQLQNIVRVDLREDVEVDLDHLERHFTTTSSCGVCGKASMNSLRAQGVDALPRDRVLVTAKTIHQMPHTLRAAQKVFAQTGGLHAAALFDTEGHLQLMREDIGRHNALDKLIGAQLLAGSVMNRSVLFLSGRVSFELVQKALVARIPIVAAVGAPSSLAVEMARQFGLTLLGFVRDGRFNIYSGDWRIREACETELLTTTEETPSANEYSKGTAS
jgi:FdhD protein